MTRLRCCVSLIALGSFPATHPIRSPSAADFSGLVALRSSASSSLVTLRVDSFGYSEEPTSGGSSFAHGLVLFLRQIPCECGSSCLSRRCTRFRCSSSCITAQSNRSSRWRDATTTHSQLHPPTSPFDASHHSGSCRIHASTRSLQDRCFDSVSSRLYASRMQRVTSSLWNQRSISVACTHWNASS